MTRTEPTNEGETMQAIGTKVISNDGFETTIGQVADHISNKWGEFHLVAVGGEFKQVGTINEAGKRGIGWKVATPQEVARHNRNQSRQAG